ncbi:MAG: glycerol-3-phosphate 1-O-acyltransferase PlsY [Terriglobales bacterium]
MSTNLLIIALVAYLIGSIPFGYILVKVFLKQDIRQTGSGNIGATNVARSGNKGLAIATLLLDAGKGAAAVLAGMLLDDRYLNWFGAQIVSQAPGHTPYPRPSEVFISMALAALIAVIGHCFPVWLKFKGGKGVATAIGAFAFFSPKAAFAAFVCFGLVFVVTRYVSLSSVISALVFPLLVYLLSPELRAVAIIAMAAAVSLLIIAKHHGNIRRLIAGTEPKFGKQAIGTNDPGETEKSI